MDVWTWLAVASSGLFAGGAVFVSVAEHPGRLAAGREVALAEFGPSYRRAAPWQASLAGISLISGLQVGSSALAGALMMAGVLTISVAALLKPSHALVTGHVTGDEGLHTLRRWGWLHAVRTAFGLGAFLTYLAGV